MKDYAKKNYTKRKQRKRSPLLLLAGIVLVGAFLTYYFFIFKKHPVKKNIPENHSTEIKLPKATVKKDVSIKTDSPNKSTTPDFNFSFYKMLPKMSVSTPAVQKATSKTNTDTNKQYFLQVSSSKDKNGASLLKKQLTEYGFPTIETSTVRKNKRWYHIFLGPYTYLNQAKSDQYRLYRDFHMNGILSVVNNNDKTT
jgi:cell division protein FtsN